RLIHESLATQVYQATDSRLNRQVAIKMLKPSIVRLEPSLGTQFLDEARIVARLSHPNVVAIFDVGVLAERPYFVMPMLAGESLRTRLERGPLTNDESCSLILSLIDGLKAAHRIGIIHKDLKPENLWLRPTGNGGQTLMLIDFGIAQMANTAGSTVAGTPFYWSPEQVLQLVLDERTDFFGVGCVLFEMLTGSPAWAASSLDDFRNPLEDKRLTDDFRAILSRLMTLDPDQRYPDHDAIMADIKAVLEPPAVALPTATRPNLSRKAILVAGAGFMATALLASGLYLKNELSNSNQPESLARPPGISPPDTPNPKSQPGMLRLLVAGKPIQLRQGSPVSVSPSGLFAGFLPLGDRLTVFDSRLDAASMRVLKDSEGAGRVWINHSATMVASLTENKKENAAILKVWRIDSPPAGREIAVSWTERLEERTIYDCAWSQAGDSPRLLLAMDSSQIRYYDFDPAGVKQPRLESIQYGYSLVTNLYAHPTEPIVMAAKNRGGLDMIDLSQKSIRFSFRAFETGPPAIAWMPDGFSLIAISPDGQAIRYDRRNFVERSKNGHAYLIGQPLLKMNYQIEKAIRVSDTHLVLLQRGRDATLKILNTTSNQIVSTVLQSNEMTDIMALSGNKFAAIRKNGQINT
ncbi:MAG: serine/threonine-protein kinase, partial [bacterium]